jgi:ribosome-associated protein
VLSKDLVKLVEDAVDDLKGIDVTTLDVSKLKTFTDYLVIVSGTSTRHVRSIANRIVERAKEAGAEPLGVEGQEHGEWVVVDLGDVVAHIMQPGTRDFYKLENLWVIDGKSKSSGKAWDAKAAN